MFPVMATLTPASFWILTALASQRRHGYDILRETAEASDGRVTLKVATLYAALERLEDEGLVRSDGEEVVDGRTRRYFRITDSGGARLAAEAEAMAAAARVAQARLSAPKTARTAAVPA